MRKVVLLIMIVLMISCSSCSNDKNNQNVITENTTASTTEKKVNTNKSDNSKVVNLIDNPITDTNNPAYCLGKQVSVAENFFNTSFISDGLYYGDDSFFVTCDLTTGLVVSVGIELFDYDLDYLGLKLNMSYDDVCSVLKQKGYRIKTDENKAKLYFAEQTDYYTGLCTFDNIDDALQEVEYFVNTNEISLWVTVPSMMYKNLDSFAVIAETHDGFDSDGYPIIVETVYGNDDESAQIYFDMYSALTKVVVDDNSEYSVFGVKTGMNVSEAKQILESEFSAIEKNTFKDSRGNIIKITENDNVVNIIELTFEPTAE